MIDYFCALFMGDCVKRQPRRIIRKHVGLKRNAGGTRGGMWHVTTDATSRRIHNACFIYRRI
jgi:hypothetical protein